ncbi:polysaccharide deacetylase family protein [Erythrobacter sp. sf7]|uniref:Polysaccharide deacetylase family protein n=1 Tax=Erythrobacter fulvus TaxID=2987523 RepID=A0ABT5JQE7_9SPHN|nr:polysaccharide deacetylase family protein [Erythrobacter fulvus]MDC8755002.1 polysaccharide deacetylase family protein [Erythrobacter fulvus]
MLNPPAPSATAQFAPHFGQRVLLTIDTEEEFDWSAPFRRDGYGLSHVKALPRFQNFCEEIGAHPVYLVDWPVATDPAAVEIIGDAVRRGTADIGVQLHPWVNPPFGEEITTANTFAGNLPHTLEAAKFTMLRDRIEQAFGTAPLIYRAGRYGLGPGTAGLLKAAGIRIDTSVRPLFDYSAKGGPDYSRHPLVPYWADAERELLELPITSVHWGLLRNLGAGLQRLSTRIPLALGALSRLSLLERIALTPEGVSIEEAIRGIDIAHGSGLPVLVLSFHSPTLAAGFTRYAADEAGVEALYGWLARIYADLDRRGISSCTVADIISATSDNA